MAETPPPASPFGGVPIEITISVGKTRPLIRDLLNLQADAVLALDRKVDDPVELYVGDQLIAQGQLEEVTSANGTQLAVRITSVTGLAASLG